RLGARRRGEHGVERRLGAVVQLLPDGLGALGVLLDLLELLVDLVARIKERDVGAFAGVLDHHEAHRLDGLRQTDVLRVERLALGGPRHRQRDAEAEHGGDGDEEEPDLRPEHALSYWPFSGAGAAAAFSLSASVVRSIFTSLPGTSTARPG